MAIIGKDLAVAVDELGPFVHVRLPDNMPFDAQSLESGMQILREAFPTCKRIEAGYAAHQGTRFRLVARHADDTAEIAERLNGIELRMASSLQAESLEFLYLDRHGWLVLEPTQATTAKQTAAFFRAVSEQLHYDIAAEGLVAARHRYLLFSAKGTYDGMSCLTTENWRASVPLAYGLYGEVSVRVNFDKKGRRTGTGAFDIKLPKGLGVVQPTSLQQAFDLPEVQSIVSSMDGYRAEVCLPALEIENPSAMCEALWPHVVRFAKALGVHPAYNEPLKVHLDERDENDQLYPEGPTTVKRMFPPISNR